MSKAQVPLNQMDEERKNALTLAEDILDDILNARSDIDISRLRGALRQLDFVLGARLRKLSPKGKISSHPQLLHR